MKSVLNLTARRLVVLVLLFVQIAMVIILHIVLIVLLMLVDMRLLQTNIQSINTSQPLLRHAVQRLHIDVILLQEIWHPADGKINIYNYTHAIIKTRQSSQGGGVAIIAHRNVKVVHLKEYEVDNLEAVWADVMVGKVRTVVGSVYIPPGDIVALSKLDSVVGEIVKEHDHLVICMDANSRSTLWDDKCVGIAQSCRSLQMGAKLEEMIHRFSLQIHNSGVSTYYSGNSSTTPDVTLSRGIIHYGNICWSTIDDDLNSPHLGILMNIGHKRETVRKHVIDWPNFDWSAYRVRSRVMLSELKNKWLINTSISTDVMADELSTGIQKCVNDVADTKFVTEHSKPWIDKVLSEQFKILRNQAKKCRLRKSPTNVAKYTELQQETINMVKQAEQQW